VRRSIEVSGKNLEEVLERASRYFEVDKEELGYEILAETRGFLGILSPRMVRVKVWMEDGEGNTASQPDNIPEKSNEQRVRKEEKYIPPQKPHVKTGTGQQRREPPEEKIFTPEELSMSREELRNFFEGLATRMELEVEFHVRDNGKKIHLDIDGKDAGILIGKHGETMEAVETLLKTFLIKRGFHGVGLEVDISGYRKRRIDALTRLAKRMADRVAEENKRLKLEPMSARERRIIHTTLKNHPQVTTYSVGSDPDRRVVIDLKNARKRYKKHPQQRRK